MECRLYWVFKKYSLMVGPILSQSTDLFNGQIMYYLNICKFDLSLNIPLTIYITTMFHLLIFKITEFGRHTINQKMNNGYVDY